MNKIILTSCILAGLVSGCEKQRENIVETVKEPGIQGKSYFAKCSTSPFVGLATGILTGESLKSYRVQMNFLGANITRATILYPTGDCTGNAAFTFKEMGRFGTSEQTKTADGASSMDLNYDELAVDINSDIGVTVANGVSLCGTKDWKTGDKDRKITANSSQLNCYAARVPRLELNIFKREGSLLFMGQPGLSLTGDPVRPTELDRTNELVEGK